MIQNTKRPSKYQSINWPKGIFLLTLSSWSLSFVFGFSFSLQILMIIGFAVAILGLRKPIGVIGIGILCTIDAVSRVYVLGGGFLPWNTLNYWLLLVIILHLPFLLRMNNRNTRFLQMFVILLLIGLTISQDFIIGLQGILSIVSVFGILCYFVHIPKDDSDTWIWFGLICGSISAVGGFIYLLNFSLGLITPMNENAWAYFPLAGMFALHLATNFSHSNRTKNLFWLLQILNLVWVFLSGSRGSLVLGIVIVAIYLFNTRDYLVRRLQLVLAAFLIAFLALSQFSDMQNIANTRFAKTFDLQISLAQRSNGRSDLALGGLYIFYDNPILGTGTGSFSHEWANLGNLSGVLTTRLVGLEYSAHAGWIKILAENGIVGFLLLALYVLSFTFDGLQFQDGNKKFIYGFGATLILSLAWTTTEFQGKALWLLAAGTTIILLQDKLLFYLKSAESKIPINLHHQT